MALAASPAFPVSTETPKFTATIASRASVPATSIPTKSVPAIPGPESVYVV